MEKPYVDPPRAEPLVNWTLQGLAGVVNLIERYAAAGVPFNRPEFDALKVQCARLESTVSVLVKKGVPD